MLTHGGEAAETAITAHERRFHVEVLADWNKDGGFDHELSDLSRFVESAETDRSLHGSSPEELLLIEGASAAELTVNLGGEPLSGMSWASIFSPYNGFSPFYLSDLEGAEIKYKLGIETVLGIVWYQQFVGNIRTITPDRGGDTVEITALDRVEKLRRPIQFPKWSVYETAVNEGKVAGQLALSSWVIDHCLRFCDTSPTPLRPTYFDEMNVPSEPRYEDGVHFWLTGTGGHVPTIGWLDNSHALRFPDTEGTGKWMWQDGGATHPDSPSPEIAPPALAGMGNDYTPDLSYWADDRDLIDSDSVHYLGFTLVTRGDRGDFWKTAVNERVLSVRIGDRRVIRLFIDQGEVYSEYQNETITDKYFYSPRFPIPEGRDYVHVWVVWVNSSQSTQLWGRLVVGEQDTGMQDWGDRFTGVRDRDPHKGLIVVRHRMPLNDVFYGSRNMYWEPGHSTPHVSWAGWRPAKYPAGLDKGLNYLSYLPDKDGQDAWDVITEVAAAEFGSVFWDENGVFHFWNQDTVLSKQDEIVQTLTLDEISGLKMTRSLDSVRNVYSVELNRNRSRYGRVYESTSVNEFIIPPRTRRIFRLYVDNVQAPEPGFLTQYTTHSNGDPNPDTGNPVQWNDYFPKWSDSVDHGYVLQWYRNGSWYEPFNYGPDISMYFDVDGLLVVNVWNGTENTFRLATDAGDPAFRFLGTGINQGESSIVVDVRDEDSVNKYGARNYRLSGDWYQEFFDRNYGAKRLIDQLVERTSKPIPATDAVTVAGDPRRQLGDTIGVVDPDGFGEFMKLQILGIRRRFDINTGLTDTLTVEMVRPAGVGIWDSDHYGRWDETFIWS